MFDVSKIIVYHWIYLGDLITRRGENVAPVPIEEVSSNGTIAKLIHFLFSFSLSVGNACPDEPAESLHDDRRSAVFSDHVCHCHVQGEGIIVLIICS